MLTIRIAAAAAIVLLTGCLEYHTTTTVRDDGSLVRTVVIRGDSASTHRWDFVVPVDSTWTWERVKSGDREWTLTARRQFASAEALNAYQSSLTSSTLRSTVSLDRTFRWFTTVYRYREHLPSVNPLRSVPLTNYLSPAEREAFLAHEVQKRAFASPGDSLAMEDASERFEVWARRNEFEVLLGALRVGARRAGDRAFTPESIDARKERLFAAYEALKDTGDVFDAEDFVRRKDLWLKQSNDPALRRAAAGALDSIEAIVTQLRELHRLMEFPHKTTIILPGLLTSANARKIEGASATWEDYLVVLYFQDFTFEAESAVTNWWAVVVTGLLALGVPIGWYAARRRRR